MSWLLDTNVLSELRKGERANRRVRAWFEQAASDELFTSVIVVGEIRRGLELVRRRDAKSAAALEQWLLRMYESFGERILEVDAEVADLWGRLNVPDPLPVTDGLLAATALAHDLTLVTRNTRDVERTGVRLLNPFEA